MWTLTHTLFSALCENDDGDYYRQFLTHSIYVLWNRAQHVISPDTHTLHIHTAEGTEQYIKHKQIAPEHKAFSLDLV